MDVGIKSGKDQFKFRVGGMLIKDNKLLTVDIADNGFLCLPGGHVELHETTEDAVVREMEEETNIKCRVKKLRCVVENFFNSKTHKVHELLFIYELECDDSVLTNDFVMRTEFDRGDLKFYWVDLDDPKIDEVRPHLTSKVLKEENLVKYTVKDSEIEK